MVTSKKNIKKLDDIIVREVNQTIDLRKKRGPILEIFLGLAVLFVIGGLIFYGLKTKAEIADFYPSVSLGTWKNVEKVIGQPDLDWEADFEEFNENNSAVFEGGGVQQIFLGGFNGQIPEEPDATEIERAVLKINWRMGDKIEWFQNQSQQSDLNLVEPSPTLFLTSPTENETSTTENNSTSTLDQLSPSIPNLESSLPSTILPEENVSQGNSIPTVTSTPSETVLPTESATLTVIPTVTPTATPTETPAESPIETSTPISLMQFLIKKVFAEEEMSPTPTPEEQITPTPTEMPELTPTSTETPDPTSTPTEISAPTPTIELTSTPTLEPISTIEPETSHIEEILLPSASPSLSSSEMPTTSSIESLGEDSPSLSPEVSSTLEISSLSPTPVLAPLFEIKYTLDGQNWQTLAAVDKENFPTELEIPLSDWAEIANLQIMIESTINTNLEENLIVFLDGACLEMEYEKQPEETITPTENTTPDATPFIDPQIEALLKLLNKQYLITDIHLDKEAKHSCFVEPFSLTIREGEIHTALIKLKKNPDAFSENLQIGNLPERIEIFFDKNINYSIQPAKNENELEVKIMALANLQKGSFNIPIIYESDNSQTICQINIISL